MQVIKLERDRKTIHLEDATLYAISSYVSKCQYHEYFITKNTSSRNLYWAIFRRGNPVDKFCGWQRTLAGVRRRILHLEQRAEHFATGNPFPLEAR